MVLFRDSGGERGGDPCVDRVAALFEDAVTGFHFVTVAGTDHLLRAADGGEHGVRVLRGKRKREEEQGGSGAHLIMVARRGRKKTFHAEARRARRKTRERISRKGDKAQRTYWLSNRKYSSRDMLAMRRLFLMMNTGTSEYRGITTGRIAPGLVKTM